MPASSRTVDSHHHFWRYTKEEYGWIDDSMSTLRRDFLPADLRKELTAAHIDGAVSVQARQPLDHIAKPRIRDGVISPWQENLRELARRENVVCKLSGVATESNFKTWTEADLRRYMDVALEAFGPKRIMFGSDWPVCLAAIPYV